MGDSETLRGQGGLYRRLGRNMAYLAGGTGGAALLGMLAVAFNARALNAREFGLLVLLQTSALALRGLASLLTQQPLIHIGAEALDQGDRARLGRVIGRCLLYDIGGALAACAVGIIALLLGGHLIGLSGEMRGHALVFAAAIPFMGYLTSNGILRLLDRFGVMGLIQSGSALLLVIAAALLFALDAPFVAYVWVWAIYLAGAPQVQLWMALILARRNGVPVSFERVADADRRNIAKYCWSSWGMTLVDTLRTQGDSLLVGAIVTVEAAGFFNVAKQAAGALRKVTDMYSSAMFPEVARMRARSEFAAARQLRRRLLLGGAVAAIAGVIGIALIGGALLRTFFGPAFVAGYGALVVLVGGAGLQLCAHTQAVYLQVYLDPGRLFPVYAAGLVAFVLSAAAGLHYWGIIGGALGQVAFSITVLVLASLAMRGALRDRSTPTILEER